MPIATVEDMRLALGEDTLSAIADHSADGEADESVLERALAQASSLVLTYLPEGYAVPTLPAPVPDVLVRVTVDIAAMYLRQARDMATDDARAAYIAAIRWLEAVAAGKARIAPAAPVLPGETGYAPSDPEVDGLARVWSRESARRVF